MKQITDEQFFEQFQPIQNPMDDNASFDGCMFETYGAELAFVLKTAQSSPNKVWTILDCDGELVITSGYQYVNRMGYLITQVPFTEDTQVADDVDFEPDEDFAYSESA